MEVFQHCGTAVDKVAGDNMARCKDSCTDCTADFEDIADSDNVSSCLRLVASPALPADDDHSSCRLRERCQTDRD